VDRATGPARGCGSECSCLAQGSPGFAGLLGIRLSERTRRTPSSAKSGMPSAAAKVPLGCLGLRGYLLFGLLLPLRQWSPIPMVLWGYLVSKPSRLLRL
jgi:hypothetical protein